MGRRKFRLSAPKNCDRKGKGQRTVGRPSKTRTKASANATPVDDHSSPIPVVRSEDQSSPIPVVRSEDQSSPIPVVRSEVLSLVTANTSSESTSSSNSGAEPSSEFQPSSSEITCSSSEMLSPSPEPPNEVLASDLSSLSENLQSLINVSRNDHWIFQSQATFNLVIYKVSSQSPSTLVVTHSLLIYADLTWILVINGNQVDKNCALLATFPNTMTPVSLKDLLKLLDTTSICPGNPDDSFVEMVEQNKKGRIIARDGCTVAAKLDSFSPVCFNGKWYSKTIRVSGCELLTKQKKCTHCVSYRNTLRSMLHRHKSRSPSKRNSSHSKTNLRWLTTPEKTRRYTQLRSRLDTNLKKIKRLEEKVGLLIEKNHVTVDQSLQSDFKAIMNEMTEKVNKEYADDSFKKVFWNEQLKLVNSNPKQIRWHPAIIKWCLHLKFISSGAYHALRQSGLITLPSERTLRDYSHCIRAGTGFIPEVDAQLVKEAKLTSDKDRYVVLSWDEMKIKENLVFDKHDCQLIGFTKVGEVNDVLDKMEQEVESESHTNVSTHMLLFMVRGMFSTLEFPYAHFATRGITADALYPIVWEAVQRLELCGMNVIAFCCDGASPNRKFYKMHATSKKLAYKTPNPYSEDGREIYFISDVPHLIKTTRNCWANSLANKFSRALWKDGKYISWAHLVSLYNRQRTEAGLSLVPKLRRDHIFLTSYSRMKVNLAAQVLSGTVAHAFEYYGDSDTEETIKFIKMFDKFFDCFNVRCVSESVQKRKPDLRPYRDPCDSRLSWLVDVFLKYLLDWEDSVNKRRKESTANNSSTTSGKTKRKKKKDDGLYSAGEREKMLLSTQTREGLRFTVHSFVEMAPLLLSVPGVEYVFTEKLCQDPLESFFGKQRAAGGRSDNPTVQQFCQNTVSLRVQGSAALEPVRGNCGKRSLSSSGEDSDLATPLPKRARHHKH